MLSMRGSKVPRYHNPLATTVPECQLLKLLLNLLIAIVGFCCCWFSTLKAELRSVLFRRHFLFQKGRDTTERCFSVCFVWGLADEVCGTFHSLAVWF